MCVGRAKNYFDGQSRLGAPSAAFLLTQVSLPILRALIAGKKLAVSSGAFSLHRTGAHARNYSPLQV